MPGCTDNQRRHLLYEGDLKLKEGSTKMDVHIFLFNDMMLICKNLTKRQLHSSQSTDAKVKVIRPPYVVDRLQVVDITRDSTGGSGHHSSHHSGGSGNGGLLAVVYLNEYNTVSAAFTLHSNESKVIRAWKEQIKKSQRVVRRGESSFCVANRPLLPFILWRWGK